MSRREGTLYARVGLQLADHPRAVEAGEDAMGLYLFLLLYTRSHELDGMVPRAVAERGWTGARDENRARLSRLCDVGLLRSVDACYEVLNYAEFNETREEIRTGRLAAKERMRSLRVRRTPSEHPPNVTRVFADVPVSVSVSDQKVEEIQIPEVLEESGEQAAGQLPAEEPSGVRELPADESATAKRARREGELREAYRRGVEAGKGGPFAWVHRWNRNTGQDDSQGDLHAAIATFAKNRDGPIRGQWLTKWVEDYAHDFALHVVSSGDDPRFWSDFQAKGFLKFMNVDTRKKEARKHG